MKPRLRFRASPLGRPFVLALVMFALASGIVFTVLYPRVKTFTATALTQVQTDQVAATLGLAPAEPGISLAQQHVRGFRELMNDNSFMQAALDSADLSPRIDTDPRFEDPRFASLQKRLSAYAQSGDLFAITLTWDNRNECERIVSAFRSQYCREIGQDRAAQSVQTISFLDSRIRGYEQKMRMAERLLSDYQASPAHLPAQRREVTDKTRGYTVWKAEYEDLLRRREQVQLQADVDRLTSESGMIPLNMVFAQPAVDKARLALLLLISFVLGLILALLGTTVLFGWGWRRQVSQSGR